MAVIEVEDFHKAYERTIAVRGLSFRVEGGQILGLIGPNGAGKTTTLRTLAGIMPASRGQINVSGYDVQKSPIQAKRQLAYIPDEPQLFLDLTVLEHLQFAATAYRVTGSEKKINQLMEEFELSHKRDAIVSELSRGMKQKLAVCGGYLHDPQAIFFDEPLTGLDPHGIRRLKDSMIQRAAEGAAIIVSSHLLAMVEDICTHVLILSSGEQRFWGPLQEVRSQIPDGSTSASLEEFFFMATSPHYASSSA